MLFQGCFGATIGKAKQAAKTEIEKIKVWCLIVFVLRCFLYLLLIIATTFPFNVAVFGINVLNDSEHPLLF